MPTDWEAMKDNPPFEAPLPEDPETRGYAPVRRDALDLEDAKAKLDHFKAQVEDMRVQALQIEIVNDATKTRASEMLGQVVAVRKAAKARTEAIVKDSAEYVKSTRNHAKGIALDPLDEIEGILKNKLTVRKREEDTERARLEEAARKRQEEIESQARAAGTEPPPPAPPVFAKPGPTRTAEGTTYEAEVPDLEIINVWDIPKQYFNEDKVKAAVDRRALLAVYREGGDLPGVRFFMRTEIRHRR